MTTASIFGLFRKDAVLFFELKKKDKIDLNNKHSMMRILF